MSKEKIYRHSTSCERDLELRHSTWYVQIPAKESFLYQQAAELSGVAFGTHALEGQTYRKGTSETHVVHKNCVVISLARENDSDGLTIFWNTLKMIREALPNA